MRHIVTTEQASQMNIVNGLRQSDAEAAQQLADEINEFYPAYVVHTIDEEDGKLYYQHSTVRLRHETLEITVKKYRNKFSIHSPSCNFHNFKNLDYYAVERAERELKEPQKIGVLTTNKIVAWIKYYEELHAKLLPLDEANGNKKAEFLKSIEGLPVRWWDNGKKGEIIINGIQFSFSIEETYISQKIEIHYNTPNNFSTFLKLTKGEYKG